MATTLQAIGWLANGARDASGNVLASGIVRFYIPGTTTERTVYQDSAAATPWVQPITLSSAGKATVYALNACRMVVKTANDVTTILDLDPANITRAQQVYITNANVNGGAEITLDAFLSLVSSTSVTMYLEGSAATSRSFASWMRERVISVVDYGATGDGAADDTAEIQAAIDRAMAADRTSAGSATSVIVEIPVGTWLISSALTMTNAAGNKPIILRGHGANRTIIKQSSTTANGLTVNWSVGSTDAKITIEGIQFTCSTTSSGAAIHLTSANNTIIRDCEFNLFRTGVNTASATGTLIDNCDVMSTDGNAAAAGITTGDNTAIRDCILAGSSSNGEAINGAGNNVEIRNPVISGWADGIDVTGTDVHVAGGSISATTDSCKFSGADCTAEYVNFGGTPTRAINLNAAGCKAIGNKIAGAAATGITIGAVADCVAAFNRLPTATAQISINASATNFTDIGNSLSDSKSQRSTTRRLSWSRTSAATGNLPASVVPVYDGGPLVVNRYIHSNAGAGGTLTISPTLTTGLQTNLDVLLINIVNDDTAGGVVTLAFDAQYTDGDNSTFVPGTIGVGESKTFGFLWTGSAWNMFLALQNDN